MWENVERFCLTLSPSSGVKNHSRHDEPNTVFCGYVNIEYINIKQKGAYEPMFSKKQTTTSSLLSIFLGI